MIKKIFITSSIILITLCICFAAIYGFMLSYCNNIEDYSDDIIGQWRCIQYYSNGQSVVCKDESVAELIVDETTFVLKCSEEFPSISSPMTALSGKTMRITSKKNDYTLYFDFNSKGQLKLTINEIDVVFIMDSIEY